VHFGDGLGGGVFGDGWRGMFGGRCLWGVAVWFGLADLGFVWSLSLVCLVVGGVVFLRIGGGRCCAGVVSHGYGMLRISGECLR